MEVKEIKYVEKLKESYEEKELTKLDELRVLDKKTKKGANVFAYVFGVVGSLILGFGMSVAMEIILKGYMYIGIIVGLVGIVMVSVNYLIYKKIRNSLKKKYGEKIIGLSNEILNENNN